LRSKGAEKVKPEVGDNMENADGVLNAIGRAGRAGQKGAVKKACSFALWPTRDGRAQTSWEADARDFGGKEKT